ncbi:endonuclease/exonuclease/phosphatase family protein [Photobacterium sp. DA100]|uniref:endonuclease/exonuclease/phosphatase family protein n=1 Tax=Photobacterium sp. DA100 TaxID=3027472 RepID=UPI0024788911|nr:endonuclease/exonuclease/phosphatase family protein [Photobacterium sp. DA100]WEM43526.1 endonuclease/exonuclease/phosphatase family protein [Photobacterium sp. DA100]
MRIRIANYNLENIFNRFDFSAFGNSQDADRSQRYLPPIVNYLTDFRSNDLTEFEDFKQTLRAAFLSQEDDKRQHTALAIKEADADLLCLQEVDSIDALLKFRDLYLNKTQGNDYKQVVLHEGNDRRGIDVAAMATAKFPIYSRSHAHMTRADLGSKEHRDELINRFPVAKKEMNKRGRIFNRDCLELEVRKDGKELTVFVCHFKSMGGGRDKTIGERTLEALAVRHLIESKFDNPEKANWIVIGDLNDYREQVKVRADGSEDLVTEESSGLDPLLDGGFAVNLVSRLEPMQRWTHYYSWGKTKSQLDYILVSPAIANANHDAQPEVIRNGMPLRVPNTDDVERFPRIGWDRPKASDHCPVVVTVTIP